MTIETESTVKLMNPEDLQPQAHTNGNGHAPKLVFDGVEVPTTITGDDAEKWLMQNAKFFAGMDNTELEVVAIELRKPLKVSKGFLEKWVKHVKKFRSAIPQDDDDEVRPQKLTWQTYALSIQKLGFALRMNDLDDCIEVNGERLSDGVEAQLLMRMHDIGLTKAEWVKRSYTATAHQNRYHPVKDFLNGLHWDGKDWIAEFERYVWDKHTKIEYADGSAMPVFGAWLRRWGVGAVAKIMQDGKLRAQNPMLVLIGDQNAGKSTLTRFLCPMSDEYFIESQISPDNKDHDRYLATKMVWEVAELGATTRKADREGLKAFLTRQDVTFRVPYAHHPVTKPALASFIGTINPEIGFLNDPTGNRRYLPVEIKKIDFAYIKAIDPQQLWAQFVALYRAGESVQLTPEEKVMADQIRLGHEVEDNYAGFILKYYTIDRNHAEPGDGNLDWSTTTTDVVEQLTLNGVRDANVSNIGAALKSLKMTRARQRVEGVQETRWYGLQRNNVGDKQRR